MNLEVIDKPEGITTHRSSPIDWGLIEHVSQERATALFVIHRLDKETSGVLLAARDQVTAQKTLKLFEGRSVQKKYYFLTDRSVSTDQLNRESWIERTKEGFVSSNTRPSNSSTEFSKVWTENGLSLWQAQPISGKPHQIRLHAQDLGIPVLGDHEHGGSPWFRLALHAEEINFNIDGKSYQFTSRRPWWTDSQNSFLIQQSPDEKKRITIPLWNALEKRQRLKLTENSTYRLSHDESKNFRVDIYGSQAWISWYADSDPTTIELQAFDEFFNHLGKSAFVRRMNNRGQDPNSNQSWCISKVEPVWTASENGLRFELRTSQGLSAGLFLDQRANRRAVKEQSQNLRILNLYAYTCGFSLAAAAGGASEVCSVDVSSSFLEWGKRNFELNQLDPKKFEFWSQDCFLFLKGAEKRRRQFDFIIVDPPSFGRSKERNFRLERDWKELLSLCGKVLAPQGKILFSNNYEKWTLQEFHEHIQHWADQNDFLVSEAPIPELDYELSTVNRLLKTVILQRKF